MERKNNKKEIQEGGALEDYYAFITYHGFFSDLVDGREIVEGATISYKFTDLLLRFTGFYAKYDNTADDVGSLNEEGRYLLMKKGMSKSHSFGLGMRRTLFSELEKENFETIDPAGPGAIYFDTINGQNPYNSEYIFEDDGQHVIDTIRKIPDRFPLKFGVEGGFKGLDTLVIVEHNKLGKNKIHKVIVIPSPEEIAEKEEKAFIKTRDAVSSMMISRIPKKELLPSKILIPEDRDTRIIGPIKTDKSGPAGGGGGGGGGGGMRGGKKRKSSKRKQKKSSKRKNRKSRRN